VTIEKFLMDVGDITHAKNCQIQTYTYIYVYITVPTVGTYTNCPNV
jgi:hypothetical protein